DAASRRGVAAARPHYRRRAGGPPRGRARARREVLGDRRAEGRVHARRHSRRGGRGGRRGVRRCRRRRRRSLRLRESGHGYRRDGRRAVRRARRSRGAAAGSAARRAGRRAAARALGRRCGRRRREGPDRERPVAGSAPQGESAVTPSGGPGSVGSEGSSTTAAALLFDSEDALIRAAAETARRWAESRIMPTGVAFGGDLGSGKTTWVRAMLRGLGYQARVPSPTYTLVEHYPIPESDLTVVHLDLYRLADDTELDNLGLRDWLAEPATWLLVEWPERSAALHALADVEIVLELAGPSSRRARAAAKTARGREAVDLLAWD